jgi:carbonic anhydrase/acetyltransferase-like protein (isoleucine patch superfamily)
MTVYAFGNRIPKISARAYISPESCVIGDVVIGPDCYVGPGAVVRGDYGRIVIDEGTAVEEGVILHIAPDKTLSVGKKVTFGHGATVHGKRIEDLAVIGMGAVVSNDAVVGRESIVAEGAVVISGQIVEADVMVAGTPAKVIRELEERDRAYWAWGKQLYVELVARYLETGMKTLSPDEYLTNDLDCSKGDE